MLFRSRFSHYYVRNDRVCIFHSLTSRVIFGDRRLLGLFLEFPAYGSSGTLARPRIRRNEAINSLIKAGLLVESDAADRALVSRLREDGQTLHKNQLRLMYLIPTANCNLACKYCFVDDRTATKAPMTIQTAREAVEYLFRHSDRTSIRTIIFYGGEPLLNPRAVLAAADRANDLSREAKAPLPELTVITNGTLVTRALAKELSKRRVVCSVSIDGPERVHNAFRLMKSGSGSFKKSFRGLRILQDTGANPSVSCTITPASITHWRQVIDFLLYEAHVKSLGFNLLHPSKPGNRDITYAPGKHPVGPLLEAFCEFREKGIYEDRVMRRVKPFCGQYFHFKDCLGVGGQIAVGPDGSVGPCQALLGRKDYFPLHVVHDRYVNPYKNKLFRDWTRRFPLNFDECVQCPAVAICGGGCPYDPLCEGGSIWDIDNRICEQAKPIHQWLMWELQNHTSAPRGLAD